MYSDTLTPLRMKQVKVTSVKKKKKNIHIQYQNLNYMTPLLLMLCDPTIYDN